MKSLCSILLLFVLGAFISGCGEGPSAQMNAQSITPVSIDSSKYILADEPDGAVGVIAARESAQDGDPIVLVGRIGGATNPWINGRAAFMLLDASKSIVAVGTESTGDELCTGDCCAVERAACTALVKVVDESKQVLAVDARQLLGLTESDMVVVRGKVSKGENGNFLVLADGVYRR